MTANTLINVYRHDKTNILRGEVLRGVRLKESVSAPSSVPVPESHYQLAVAQNFSPGQLNKREVNRQDGFGYTDEVFLWFQAFTQ